MQVERSSSSCRHAGAVRQPARAGLAMSFLLAALCSHEAVAQSAASTSCEGMTHPECHAMLASGLDELGRRNAEISRALADAEARITSLEEKIAGLIESTGKPLAVIPLQEAQMPGHYASGDDACTYSGPDSSWVAGGVIAEDPSSPGDCGSLRFVRLQAVPQ